MKLLFDCTELSYYNENSGHRAGVFYVSLNLFRKLKEMGVDITFYCDYRRYYFIKEIAEFSNLSILREESFMNRFVGKVMYFADKLPLRLKYAFLILSRYYETFHKAGKRSFEEFDAYFSPFTPPSKEIQNSKLKRFRMIHDVIPILENGMSKSPRNWYHKIYNSINGDDFYVTNSQATRVDVLKYFPIVSEDNIKTTLLGVNEEFKPCKTTTDKKYIFSLCTLGKRKNLIFALKNYFEFIKKNNINDLYFMLGGSVWKKFEKELYDALGDFDKSKIIFTGYVKDEDLPSLYSNAMMFVYPSLYEGFGLPVLEAMKCGCPVITSNVSSLPEVIGQAGITIDPTNDEEMVSAYEKFYYDNFLRELCAERGMIRAREFTWENCAKEILDFINEKLNQPNK